MTTEEMNAFIETEAGKTWLEPIVAGDLPKFMGPTQISSMIEKAKEPLLSKRDELINETKAERQKRQDLEGKVTETTRYLHLLEDFNVGLDDEGKVSYSKVEEVLRNLRTGKNDPAAGANGAELVEVQRKLKNSLREYETLGKELNTKNEAIKSAQADIEVRDDYIHQLLITNTMSTALAEAGYPAITIKNILPNLVVQSGAQVNYDDSKDIAQRWSAITDDNRPIKEWVDYWSKTDEGLFFMPGRDNAGGGAGGSGNGGTSKSFADMDQNERTALYRKDPALYRKMRDASKNG